LTWAQPLLFHEEAIPARAGSLVENLDIARVMDDKTSIFVRGKIIAICQAILNEEIGVIAGSRIIDGLEFELIDYESGSFSRDKDFLPFVAINSETDHLPVDRERSNWSEETLERKDKEIAAAEAAYKECAFEACKKLVERFALKTADVSE
jgi:hypothetical protein